MAAKLSKRTKDVAEFAPLIKLCLIQRLSTEECLELFEKNGHKISERTWFRLKKEYNQGTNARFLEIAKSEWAEEHLLIIDKFKEIEAKYWQLFHECDGPVEGKHILDSLRATQEQITLFYNETPLIAKMKDILESKLEELNKLGKNKKQVDTESD